MTTEKVCSHCGKTKPLEEFHRDKRSTDGRRGRCGSCVAATRDRNRKNDPEKARAARARYRERHKAEIAQRRRDSYGKVAAHLAVQRALEDGRLERPALCEECGADSPLHAHHDDYSSRLDVRWLCVDCHMAWHAQHGEAPGIDGPYLTRAERGELRLAEAHRLRAQGLKHREIAERMEIPIGSVGWLLARSAFTQHPTPSGGGPNA